MRSSKKRHAFIIVALFSLLFTLSSATTHKYNEFMNVSADAVESNKNLQLLPILGDGMTPDGNVKIPDNNKTGKLTINELFGRSIRFTSYFGEGKNGPFMPETNEKLGERNSFWSEEKVQERVKSPEIRSFFRVELGTKNETGPGTFFLSAANLMTSMASLGMNALFTSSLFGSGKGAVNLIDIIGGDGKQSKGIIGMFFSSIYMPMVVISSVLVGVHLIKKGIIERKFREALSDSLWAILSVVFGIAFMMNPDILASAPYKITNGIADCVVGAVNGQNCFTGKTTVNTPNAFVGTECLSGAEGVEGLVDGMTCTVWKSFVLEPWAQAQFGVSYNDLYTANPPKGHKVWDGIAKDDNNKYCVALGSSNLSKYKKGDVVKLDRGPTVCNVALYQAYLQTNAHDTLNHADDAPTYYGVDDRWYEIIGPMAMNDANWHRWAGPQHAWKRMGAGFTAMVGAMVASALLFVLGIQGAGYKIAGTLLMAFAPLFFLLAMIPEKGRKMFLGWFESVVSSILKYLATALFALVSLMLFSSVLENTEGATSFIAIIILSSTMFAYRKEVANIIGATSMGGQRLSNQLKEKIEEKKDLGKAVAGGAAGGMLGAGKPIEGARESLLREMRKGTSTTAQMWRQYSTSSAKGKQDLDDDEIEDKVKSDAKDAGIEIDKSDKKEQDLDNNTNEDKVESDKSEESKSDEKVVETKDEHEVVAKVGEDVSSKTKAHLDKSNELGTKTIDELEEELDEMLKGEELPDDVEVELMRSEFDKRVERNPELADSDLAVKIRMAELKGMDQQEFTQASAAASKHYNETGENFAAVEASIREYGRRMNLSEETINEQIDSRRMDEDNSDGSGSSGSSGGQTPPTSTPSSNPSESQRSELSDEVRKKSADVSLPDIDEVESSDVKLPDIDSSNGKGNSSSSSEIKVNEGKREIDMSQRVELPDDTAQTSNEEQNPKITSDIELPDIDSTKYEPNKVQRQERPQEEVSDIGLPNIDNIQKEVPEHKEPQPSLNEEMPMPGDIVPDESQVEMPPIEEVEISEENKRENYEDLRREIQEKMNVIDDE